MTPNFYPPTPHPPPFLIAILVFLYKQCSQLLKFKTKINHLVTVGMFLVCKIKLFMLHKQYYCRRSLWYSNVLYLGCHSSHPQLFLTDCEASGDCPQYFLIDSFSEGISKFIKWSSFFLMNNLSQTVKSLGVGDVFQ